MNSTELIIFFDHYYETFKFVFIIGLLACLVGIWSCIPLFIYGNWFGKLLALVGILACLVFPTMNFMLYDEIKAYRNSKTCIYIDTYRFSDIETSNDLEPTF